MEKKQNKKRIYTLIERFDGRYGTDPKDDKVLGVFEARSPREALAQTPYKIKFKGRIRCGKLQFKGDWYLISPDSARHIEFYVGSIDDFCKNNPMLVSKVEKNGRISEWYEGRPENHPLTRHLFDK